MLKIKSRIPVDTRSFEIVISNCPLCHGKWKFYDGALGYGSLVCEHCGFDIGEIKVIADFKK